MWGEDSLDDDYQSTSSSSDKRTTRVKKKKISRKELIRRAKIDTLVAEYNDLSYMRQCNNVRKNILNKLEVFREIKKNLKKSDRIDLKYPITIHYKDK